MHLVCGEALYDIFVAEDSSVGEPLRLCGVAGGSPFNVAIGMARLGAKVALASDISNDFLGNRLAAQLAEEGVWDHFLRRGAPSTALAVVSTDERGNPHYSFFGLDHAIYCPSDDAIATSKGVITGVHLGSIAAVLPKSAGGLLNLASDLSDKTLVSFDPNVRLAVVGDSAIWHETTERIRHHSQLIKISEEDIFALYGDVDPEALCRAWLGGRTALVVLTRGAAGASLFTTAVGRIDIPPIATGVVDAVGAGDSFMAALLTMLLRETWTTSRAIAELAPEQLSALGAFAARAAGMTCSRRGPNPPTLADLSE